MALGPQFDNVLNAAQANAPWAFSRLFDAYARSVARYARLHGARDPDDVVNEAFLGVFSGIAHFRGGESEFRSWLFTIAHRRLIDAHRKATRRPQLSDEEPRASAAGDVEDDALAAIGTQRVEEMVRVLPPDQRDVLLLRVVADLTVDQVAEALGKSPGAVKALQRRGLAALRREMTKKGVPL